MKSVQQAEELRVWLMKNSEPRRKKCKELAQWVQDVIGVDMWLTLRPDKLPCGCKTGNTKWKENYRKYVDVLSKYVNAYLQENKTC
jgi:hypothetical protein